MFDDQNTQTADVIQDVVDPAVNEQQEQEVRVETPPKEDAQERNWREIRSSMRELQRQNEVLREELTRRNAPVKQEEQDELDSLPDDEYLTKAQARKLAAKMAEKAAKDLIRQKEHESVPDKLRSRYPDFDDVVSKENVQLLIEQEPELAQSLNALKDNPYAQGIAAYKLLQKSDIMQQKLATMDSQKRVAENMKKPTVSNAAGKQGALANANMFANGLTPQLKNQLFKEMQDCARRG